MIMETVVKERIDLIEHNYPYLKSLGEQTLTAKKVNAEIYVGIGFSVVCLLTFLAVSYYALADLMEWKYKNWTKAGMLVATSASVFISFLTHSRNALVLPHFLRMKKMEEVTAYQSQTYVNQLNSEFLRLFKDKTKMVDMVVLSIILCIGIYSFFAIDEKTGKTIAIWEYMKLITPIIYAIVFFRQLIYLQGMQKNIEEYEKLIDYV